MPARNRSSGKSKRAVSPFNKDEYFMKSETGGSMSYRRDPRTIRPYVMKTGNNAKVYASRSVILATYKELGRTMKEIAKVKALVSRFEFIEYCKNQLCNSISALSRIKCTLALAKAQCEVDEKSRARRMLQKVSELCKEQWPNFPSGTKLFSIWMEEAMAIQSREGWFTDYVTSYENCQKIMLSGVRSTAVRCNAHRTARAYVLASSNQDQSPSVQKKLEYFEKAIKICKLAENLDECCDIYQSAILQMINLSIAENNDKGAAIVHEILLETPESILGEEFTNVLLKSINGAQGGIMYQQLLIFLTKRSSSFDFGDVAKAERKRVILSWRSLFSEELGNSPFGIFLYHVQRYLLYKGCFSGT